MIITVDIPDALAKCLRLEGPQTDRRALELLALAAYRAGHLSRGQVSELLGFCFFETEEFLNENHAPIELSLAEFQRSSDALKKLIPMTGDRPPRSDARPEEPE